MKRVVIGILVVAAAAIGAGSEFASVRHQLTMEREAVDAAWQQVDLALQERADLMPNLGETVKMFGDRGTEVFQGLAEARGALYSARTPLEKIAANERLSSAISRLLVVSENYPRLRSNKKFLRLQEEIGATENRIAVERRRYNETLEHYNSSIQMFPRNLVAALSGFTRNDAYYHTGPGARAAAQPDQGGPARTRALRPTKTTGEI